MPKRKVPKTSLGAFQQLAPEMVSRHHSKIVAALKMVNKGMIYEQIAAYTKLTPNQVGRRLKELVKKELIIGSKDGNGKDVTRLTATGRAAQVWKLTDKGEVCEVWPGQSISDYSKAIQSVTPLTLF